MSAGAKDEPKFAPFQRTAGYQRDRAVIPWAVHLRAYEVYCEVFGKQDAMIDLEGRGCRGGFSTGELIAFLYAHSFPQAEWSRRVDEALNGLKE